MTSSTSVRCLRFIYTGNVEVSTDNSQDLLRAADQYLLEGLKRLCEYSIAQVSVSMPLRDSCSHLFSSKFYGSAYCFNRRLPSPSVLNRLLQSNHVDGCAELDSGDCDYYL